MPTDLVHHFGLTPGKKFSRKESEWYMNNSLELLKQVAHGLAIQFGRDCEVVIHDLKRNDLDTSVVYIENGHVTNRSIGAGPSSVVLATKLKNPDQLSDHLGYLTRTAEGKILKSSTMYIRGAGRSIDYILSINYDITGLMASSASLQALVSPEPADQDEEPAKITHNVNDLLDSLIEQSVALVGKPVPLMSKDDKVAAIRFLNDTGAFLITKSGDKVSQYFGISKYTLYSYIGESKE